MQPDWVWVKSRSNGSTNNVVFDSSRGVNNRLITNLTIVEDTGDEYGVVSAFNTDGFTVNPQTNLINVGGDGYTYVAWQWKANGGTTASNTDGTITSTVQANTDAGFSIITYTGTGSAATIGHGLGVTPDIIIFKRRDGTNNWDFQYKGELRLTLNLTDAEATNVLCTFTSTTTDLGSTATAEKNANGGTYVAYCFAEKQGYSKFGKYTGNGNANGPFVYTGFKPAFVIIKNTSAATNWYMWDNKRNPYNFVNNGLNPNTSNATQGTAYQALDFLSNGFKIRASVDGTWNGNGNNFIYMAFAENPFTTSTGIPATAR
jgi:hypothetical protein